VGLVPDNAENDAIVILGKKLQPAVITAMGLLAAAVASVGLLLLALGIGS
jgi:hypothetical protein